MDTREEIITAALKLFAEKGFETVSVRDVTQLAKVNLASVSYHFGNKEGLIREATSRILDPLNIRRSDLLVETIKDNGGIENTSLNDILRAFLRPVILPQDANSSHPLLSKLAARFTNNTDAKFPEGTLSIYKELLIAYVKAIYAKVPHLTPEEIRARLVFTSGAALQYIMLAPMAAALTGEEETTPREKLLEEIIDFTLNGFDPKR